MGWCRSPVPRLLLGGLLLVQSGGFQTLPLGVGFVFWPWNLLGALKVLHWLPCLPGYCYLPYWLLLFALQIPLGVGENSYWLLIFALQIPLGVRENSYWLLLFALQIVKV